VAVASLDSSNVLCAKDLVPQLRGWFRPRAWRARG
jgi:hypothetical protein